MQRASELVVKLTAFLIAAYSMTGAWSVASAFADSGFLAVESAPENAASIPEDIAVEAGPTVAVTAWERLSWFDGKTFGVLNLGGSIPAAAWLTFRDQPREAGPHWRGFAERYSVSVSTTALSRSSLADFAQVWTQQEDSGFERSRYCLQSMEYQLSQRVPPSRLKARC